MTVIDQLSTGRRPGAAAIYEPDSATTVSSPGSSYATVRVAVAVACLLGAQLLHWSVIDQHAKEWRASGVFFFVLALAEGLLTVLLVTHRRPWVAAAGIIGSAVPVMVWAWDRTLGLPFGPTKGVRGTIGRSDVMSVVFEVITIAVLWPFLRERHEAPRSNRVNLTGKVVIGITCVYVAVFSVWAMLGDQGAIHHVGATTVTTITQPTGSPGEVAPLNTSAP